MINNNNEQQQETAAHSNTLQPPNLQDLLNNQPNAVEDTFRCKQGEALWAIKYENFNIMNDTIIAELLQPLEHAPTIAGSAYDLQQEVQQLGAQNNNADE